MSTASAGRRARVSPWSPPLVEVVGLLCARRPTHEGNRACTLRTWRACRYVPCGALSCDFA
eukprot:1816654-Prymnesium_polylepis.1